MIDMQNDFISGALPVPGVQDIVDKVEDLTKMDIWHQVCYVYVCPSNVLHGVPKNMPYFVLLKPYKVRHFFGTLCNYTDE